MDGQLKVAAVFQVTVEQNNIKKNMENVEKMAMTVAENEKNVDLILFHEACLESGVQLPEFDKKLSDEIHDFWKSIAKKVGTNVLAGRFSLNEKRMAFTTRQRYMHLMDVFLQTMLKSIYLIVSVKH